MSMTPSPHTSRVYREAADAADTTSSKQVYQVWKGSNIFFFGGRLVFGPDVRSLFLTLFLILTPVVIFCVFVGRHLMKDLSHHYGLAVMVLVVVHTSLDLVLLLLTSGSDPGIIPRNSHPPEPEEEASSSSDWSGALTPKLKLPRTKDVTVNGVVVKTKYCDTCMLYRPPRCSHCSICNNCVECFDHHCPWVGQCIGRRNYIKFFAFVSFSTLLCFFIFSMCALRIKKLMDGNPPLTVWRALQKSPASGFLMAYAFLATWFVGGLTVFHLYLISKNQTTYENFRYRYEKKINPYDQGVLRNFKEIFCSRIPPSKVNFRAKAQVEATGFTNLNSGQRARDNMDAMGLKSGKSYGDMEIVERYSWMSKPVKGVEDMHGSMNKSEEFIEEGRHGFEDDFPEEYLPHEHQTGKSVDHSRHGRQSGNWELSPELLAFASSTGGPGIRDEENK